MRYIAACVLLTCGVQVFGQECKQSYPVIVLEEKTRTAVFSLTADQLEVRVGKAKFPLGAVEPIPRFRVLLIFDVSGSMLLPAHEPNGSSPQKYLLLIGDMLNQAFDHLPPNVEVEIGVFNNKAVFGNRFTADPKELNQSMVQAKQQLGNLGKGMTALYDAIHEGLERFDSVRAGDTILVVTDGGENHSTNTEKSLRQEVREKGVRLFTILIHWKFLEPGESSFAATVEQSGGSIHAVDTTKAFGYDEEAGELRRYWTEEVLSGYVVRFNLPPSSAHEKKWSLSPKADALPKNKFLMMYPKRLLGCSPVTATAR